MIRRLFVVFVFVLASCSTPTTPTPSQGLPAQVRNCGNLEGSRCTEAIARVLKHEPQLGTWPLVVAGTKDANGFEHRGGDLLVLVVFVPRDVDTPWSSWVVSTPFLPPGVENSQWPVEPWVAGAYPAHFQDFVREALLSR